MLPVFLNCITFTSFFWLHHRGTKPRPWAEKGQSPNRWPIREFPATSSLLSSFSWFTMASPFPYHTASRVCQQLGLRGSLHIYTFSPAVRTECQKKRKKNWMSLIKLYISNNVKDISERTFKSLRLFYYKSLSDRDRTPIGFIFSLSNLWFYEG